MDDLQITPSTLEVDYDKNLTDLYQAITDQNWDRAVKVCKASPTEAATWVVRHYEDEESEEEPEIMWRFLPLHSACARQPPAVVISALIRAYPDGAKCVDDQGMYALHYACGNQASRDVVRQLLANFPEAAKIPDPRGMLPIHYLACWGPSSVSVVDMLLVANRDVAGTKDAEGNSPLDLALEGEYHEKDSVVSALQKWLSSAPPVEKEKASTRAAPNLIQKQSSKSRKSTTASTGSSSKSIGSYPSNSGAASGDLEAIKSTSRTRSLFDDEEEKRDDSETPVSRSIVAAAATTTAATGAVAARSMIPSGAQPSEAVQKLKDEVTYLKSRMFEKELAWEMKLEEAKKSWQSKIDNVNANSKIKEDELNTVLQEQEKELNEARSKISDADSKLQVSRALVVTREEALEKANGDLHASKDELKGLQTSLGDLMEKHDTFKKKTGNLTDRLGSLSASLESMMEQQLVLGKQLAERREQRKENFSARKTRLEEFIEMEETLQAEDEVLNASLQKQTREMEAIAAVIAAARE